MTVHGESKNNQASQTLEMLTSIEEKGYTEPHSM